MVPRDLSDSLKTLVPNGIDPLLDVTGDVTWHAFEILIGPPAQPDRADHDESVHPLGVHGALKGLLCLRRPPKKLKVANCDLKLIALDMVLTLD